MSEATDTATPVDENEVPDEPDAVDTATDDQADTEATEEPEESRNAEAAKWRRQFRDAEAQISDLTERVEALQRQQIEVQINAAGVRPAAVWALTELGTLVSEEDGTVDAESVTQAIDRARNELGIAVVGKGSYVPGVGSQPAATPTTDTWSDAFAPKRR